MKLDINQVILNSNNKAVKFTQKDYDETGNIIENIKDMTVFDVISITIGNHNEIKDLKDEAKLLYLAELQKELIKISEKKLNYLNLGKCEEKTKLKKLIIEDDKLSNEIKGFVILMIENNGKF